MRNTDGMAEDRRLDVPLVIDVNPAHELYQLTGLRALMLPSAKRRPPGGLRRRYGSALEEAGRWDRVRRLPGVDPATGASH